MSSSPLGRPIRVGVFEHDPDAFNCFRTVPGRQCQKPGAEIDIIRMVMKILDWQWEIESLFSFILYFEHVDTRKAFDVWNDFGNLKPDGNFSGIMGLLADDLIDMGGLSMRITPDRMKAAHFTFPIRYFQQVYIINKPPENDFRNFIFSPFGTQLWFLLMFTIVGVAIFRFTISLLLNGIRRRKLSMLSNSVLETYGMMLKQRVPDATAISLMILEAALLTSMLVVRGNYQSTMNSKLTAPPTSAIPFYHQDGLIDLFERRERWPTYYFDLPLEGSNEKNEERLKKVAEYNPVVTHDKEEDIIKEIKKGGVFYSTYDIEFLPQAVSSWDRKQGTTVIRDTTGIMSYVAFGFSINNRKICQLFNKALIRILPGIPQLTLGPGYAQKKPPEDQTIQAKRTSLSLKSHLEQLFFIFLVLVGVCLAVFLAEIIFHRADKWVKARNYELRQPIEEVSTVIDLELFRCE